MLNRMTSTVARLDLIDRGFRAFGVASATSGLAHFVAPRPFAAISKPLFPEDTAKWVKVNGASEAIVGLALINRRTRAFGVVGLLVYGVHLGEHTGTAILRYARRGEEISEPTFTD